MPKRTDGSPELQDMYNRFRRDMLDPNKRYTLKETQTLLAVWLSRDRSDKFAPRTKQYYATGKQLNGVANNMRYNNELKNSITKNIYYYRREDGRVISRTQYRNIETGKLVTKEEYLNDMKEVGYDDIDEGKDY